MFNFFHRLMNPHCFECAAERECRACETLRMELAGLKEQNKQLLSAILNFNKPKDEVQSVPIQEVQPIRVSALPWNVRRQMMETESREKAKILQNIQTTEELESKMKLDIPESQQSDVK